MSIRIKSISLISLFFLSSCMTGSHYPYTYPVPSYNNYYSPEYYPPQLPYGQAAYPQTYHDNDHSYIAPGTYYPRNMPNYQQGYPGYYNSNPPSDQDSSYYYHYPPKEYVPKALKNYEIGNH